MIDNISRVSDVFGIVITIGLLLIGSVNSESSRRNDTLKLFYWQAPTILNPHLSTGTKDLSASRIVYEPLASFDSKGDLVPSLAAEIPSLENGGIAADGRSVVWKLKRNVKWAPQSGKISNCAYPATGRIGQFCWEPNYHK